MDQLIKWNDQLMAAPAGVVVALFAIALGYILKTAGFFPNNRIPLVVVLFTAAAFPVLQFCADKSAGTAHSGLRIPLNILFGFIIGFIAWLFHNQVLKRWMDPRIFNDDGSTKFFRRSDLPTGPQPSTNNPNGGDTSPLHEHS